MIIHTSALDPLSTFRIEELVMALKEKVQLMNLEW